jgi:hypothetical protein
LGAAGRAVFDAGLALAASSAPCVRKAGSVAHGAIMATAVATVFGLAAGGKGAMPCSVAMTISPVLSRESVLCCEAAMLPGASMAARYRCCR